VNELTTTEAARGYDAHPSVLNCLIRMGRLKAHKDSNGRWLIEKESLERWNRGRVRRPKRASCTPAR